MKTLLNIIGFAVSLLLMAATMFIHLAPHLGWRVENIRSNSMAPQLQRGTVVVAQVTAPQTITVGDIIIFRPVATEGTNLLCHRVVAIETASPAQFKTKGDADVAHDPAMVPARNLVARVSFHIPWLGYVVQFLKTRLGLLLALVIPGLLIIEMCLGGIWQELTRKKKTLEEAEGNET